MKNLEKLVNDLEAMEIIASKESSVRAFIYNIDAFAALCKNEAALNIFMSSETAMNILVDSMEKVVKIENVFVGFKKNLAEIETNLPLVTDEPVVNGIIETRRNVEKSLEKLNSITDMADTLVINMQSLFGNENYFKVLASNANASTAIANNQTCINLLCDYRATTYKYIGADYEMGKALANSTLKRTIQFGDLSETMRIGYGRLIGSSTSLINMPCNKFIALIASHSRITATRAWFDSWYHFDGKVFTPGYKRVSESIGNINIFNFYEVAAGEIVFSSYMNYTQNATHYVTVGYIPVTN